jgi:pantoate--beta-alanine ligase
MKTITTIAETRSLINNWRASGLSIGFVPTMGFLHEGHRSLIQRAFEENDKVVVSIFVNPIQFGPNEDLESYPRDLEKDKLLCMQAGANLIFNPSVLDMYEKNACTYVEVNGITTGLCGEKRPGHFKGVCTVVAKLFNIVNPHKAYFGEKDAQQLAVIKKMVQDLNIDIKIIGCPIVREPDGLAKSSRNTYLSETERKAALILNKSLLLAKESLLAGERNSDILKNIILKALQSESLARIDYVSIVDSESLEPLLIIDKPILIAIAVYIGKTRLIDNFSFQ